MGLDGKDEEIQVNLLIYSMGDAADDILRSLHLLEADSKKYDKVKSEFEAHFVQKRNIIYNTPSSIFADRKKAKQWMHSSWHSTR